MTQNEREILTQTKAQCDVANAARLQSANIAAPWAMPASWTELNGDHALVAVVYLNLDVAKNPSNSIRIFY